MWTTFELCKWSENCLPLEGGKGLYLPEEVQCNTHCKFWEAFYPVAEESISRWYYVSKDDLCHYQRISQ